MSAHYIFVTGGVVSGLGKGITAASIGLLLKSSGYSVDVVKMDPYLNVDPGTMSPYEHGEVYVLDDGSETDLDLGHYERFLDVNLTGISSVTSGKIYSAILEQEREGVYLGKNVQIIPHVTNYIKECFSRNVENSVLNGEQNHVRIIEIGGSTGDIEGEVFLESMRQFKQLHKHQVLHVHLGYVPYLQCSGEYKTKPFQTSVRDLLHSGLQPDILVARYEIQHDGEHLSAENLRKIALFGNVDEDHVIPVPDMPNIYAVPPYLTETSLLDILSDFTGKKVTNNIPHFFDDFQTISANLDGQKRIISIGIVAKYAKLSDAYLSVLESLKISGVSNKVEVSPTFIDSELLEKNDENEWARLKKVDGILVPGGFGNRGMEGKILAAKYARENNIPYLGICLGLQMAVVEFARSVCGLNAVTSEMFETRADLEEKDVLIDYIPGQENIHKKGGTMRLGGYDCTLKDHSLAAQLYGTTQIRERHRHRLEVQNTFVDVLEQKGLIISGKFAYRNEEGKDSFLVELVELDSNVHPYYIATQSHPEFLSRAGRAHPLFAGLIAAAISTKK